MNHFIKRDPSHLACTSTKILHCAGLIWYLSQHLLYHAIRTYRIANQWLIFVHQEPLLGQRFKERTERELLLTIALNGSESQQITLDGIAYNFPAESIVPLVSGQVFKFEKPGQVTVWQYNRDFYCLVDAYHEISCIGFLFFGFFRQYLFCIWMIPTETQIPDTFCSVRKNYYCPRIGNTYTPRPFRPAFTAGTYWRQREHLRAGKCTWRRVGKRPDLENALDQAGSSQGIIIRRLQKQYCYCPAKFAGHCG